MFLICLPAVAFVTNVKETIVMKTTHFVNTEGLLNENKDALVPKWDTFMLLMAHLYVQLYRVEDVLNLSKIQPALLFKEYQFGNLIFISSDLPYMTLSRLKEQTNKVGLN